MSAAHPVHSSPEASARPLGLRDLGVVIERLGRRDVGFGTVVWLRISPTASGLIALAPRTEGPEGERSGGRVQALRIGETGQVPELEVENRGGDPLLLPAHLVLAGGWQTRAVERSVVLPAGASARIPVKCVEAGRWAPRDERTARSFEVTDRTGVRTRWSTARSMSEQLARNGRFAAEQGALWQHVDEELTRTPIASRTRSYEAYLQGVKRRLVAEVKRAAVRPPLAANGAAIFPHGGGFWVEAYPTAGALAEHGDDLLADLFDPSLAHEVVAPEDDVEALLDLIGGAPLRRLDRLAGTAGDSYAMSGETNGMVAAGAAVMMDGSLAHLAFGAAPRGASGAEGSYDRPIERVNARVDERVDERVPADGPSAAKLRAVADAASQGAGSQGAGSQGAGAPQAGAPQAGAQGAASPVSLQAARPVIAAEGGSERPRVDLETMRAVFARARDLVPDGGAARERVQGFRLVRVLDRNISWIDVRITGDGYAVLGSHDRCDLVLSNDAGLWLRHLVAVCVRLEDDSVGLRLIDLKTDLPFFVDDDTPRWSILARGPFAMRLGRHVVCGFPIGPAPADDVVEGRAEPKTPPPDRMRDPQATGVLETGISIAEARSILDAPVASELSSFVPVAPVSQIQDLLGPSAATDHVRVTLERGGMGASVELPTTALDNGVLLGRALNCFDGGLRRIFCEAISRAHVLIVRDKTDVYAFDLCSTNGTRVGGQRIRRYRLADSGATLELGKKVTFRWIR